MEDDDSRIRLGESPVDVVPVVCRAIRVNSDFTGDLRLPEANHAQTPGDVASLDRDGSSATLALDGEDANARPLKLVTNACRLLLEGFSRPRRTTLGNLAPDSGVHKGLRPASDRVFTCDQGV